MSKYEGEDSSKKRRDKRLARKLASEVVASLPANASSVLAAPPETIATGSNLPPRRRAQAAEQSGIPATKTTEEKAEEPKTPIHQSTNNVLSRFFQTRAPGRPPRKADSAEAQHSPKKPADSPVTSRPTADTKKVDKSAVALPLATPKASVKTTSPLINTDTRLLEQQNWTTTQLSSLVSQKRQSNEPIMLSPFQSDPKTLALSEGSEKISTKCYYLLQLLVKVNDPSWKKEGTGFFRSITPRHIQKLRDTLTQNLETIVESFQDSNKDQFSQAVNDLFKQVNSIITEAQEKHPRFRSDKVKAFYKATENSITQINEGNFVVKQFSVPEIESQNPRSSLKF